MQRFDEDYHPLGELIEAMEEEEKRIHASFEEARRAEEADIEEGLKGLFVFFILLAIVVTVIGLLFSWLKSC